MTSPVLRELLRDPVFKRMFVAKPRLHENLAHGNPWRVWVLKPSDKWATVEKPTYAAAFAVVKAQLAFAKDAVIVSKRQLFSPPPNLTWSPAFQWCSRCRRPVRFGYFRTHHAAQNSLMQDQLEFDARCPYCGIRREAMKMHDSA